jgi:predicted molibdopterin-dependent oxidoreductase YjgC
MWEIAAALLERLGQPLGAGSPREVFARIAASVPDYAGLDYRSIGAMGLTVGASAAPAPSAGATPARA